MVALSSGRMLTTAVDGSLFAATERSKVHGRGLGRGRCGVGVWALPRIKIFLLLHNQNRHVEVAHGT